MMAALVDERVNLVDANVQRLLFRTSQALTEWTPGDTDAWLSQHAPWTSVSWRPTSNVAWTTRGPVSPCTLTLRTRDQQVRLSTTAHQLADILWQDIPH